MSILYLRTILPMLRGKQRADIDTEPRRKNYLQPPPDMVSSTMFGDVAQLGERDNRTVEVRGSSPLISTDQLCLYHETKSALQIANTYGIV